MKLSACLLMIAALHVSARGFSQKVSLSGKHASLEWVFEQLQQQTGYMFLFNDQMMAKAGRISILVKDAGIEEVLRRCFENQPLTYTMIGKTIIIKEKPACVRQRRRRTQAS